MQRRENPIIEHLRLLKKHGRLDEKEFLSAIDSLTEPENPYAVNEYLEEQAVNIAEIAMGGNDFGIPDKSVAGPIGFAIAGSQLIGFYPDECHFLIAGQTNTGKSTLLKIIFAQALVYGRGKEIRSIPWKE